MTNKIGDIIDFIKLKNQNSPWGQWNGDGSKPSRDTKNKDTQQLKQGEIEQALKKSQDFFKSLFGGGDNNSGGNSNGNFVPNKQNTKSIFGLISMGLVII